VGYAVLNWLFLVMVALIRRLGVKVRVSHISPKTGEIWGTPWSVERKELKIRRSRRMSRSIQAPADHHH
jgi:hypothetical protein